MFMMGFLATKLLALPGLLWQDAENMGWMVALILMSIDFVYAILIVDMMKRNQNKNFYEFAKQIFGAIIAKIMLAILICYFAIVLAIIGKGLELLIIQNLYEEMSWPLYGIPLMAVVGFMVYKGARNIARVMEFFWIPILFACVYIAFKAFSGVEITTFLPFFENGFEPVGQAMFKYVSWFGSSTFILMLYGFVDFSKAKKRWLFFALSLACIVVFILYFVFYGLFGITSPTHQFCITDISQFNSSRSSIGELSWLVVSLWIVAQILQFAMYSFCFVQAISLLFEIKSPTVGVLFLYAYIAFWGIWGTKTIEPEALFYSPIASWITIISTYILPILLFLGNIVVQHKNKRKGVEHEKVKVNF